MTVTGSIKKQAKSQLSNNNWGKAVVITLLTLFLGSINKTLESLLDGLADFRINFNVTGRFVQNPIINALAIHTAHWMIDVLLFVISLFIVFPVSIGVIRWAYKVANGESPNIDEVFYYFRNKNLYVRSIKFSLLLTLRTILIFALCTLPGIIISICSAFVDNINYDLGNIMLFVGTVITFIGLIAAMILLVRYFLAQYLFIIDDEANPNECIKASWKMMNGNVMKVIELILSFILWILLCCLVIPIFYVMPYMMVSQAICAKWLIDLNNKREQ